MGREQKRRHRGWRKRTVSPMISSEERIRAIIILTKKKASALAPILMSEKPCYPKCMVSHTWQNRFTHTVAAIVADALGLDCYFMIVPRLSTFDRTLDLLTEMRAKGVGQKTYWLCAASINQHSVLCNKQLLQESKLKQKLFKQDIPHCDCGLTKILDGPESEIGSFDQMMVELQKFHAAAKQHFYQVVAVEKWTVNFCNLGGYTGGGIREIWHPAVPHKSNSINQGWND